jgi:hypothetical protein
MRVRCLACVVAVVAACATGSEISEDGGVTGAGGFGEGGYGDGGDIGHGGEDDDTSSSNSSSSSSSGSGAEGGAGGSGSSAGGGGSGTGGSGSGGSPPCDFTSPNACTNAAALASVDGDDGGVVTASGTTSKWFVVHVVENNSDIFEVDMSYTVTLTSPPGMVYDLVVHQGPQDGNQDCGAAPKLGQPPGGATQTVSDSWDDDQGIGGEDDSLWLNIQVEYVSGSDCDATWTLKVEGGT